MSLCFIEIPVVKANTVDTDQMPHSVTSDLGLHCLPITLLKVSKLKRVNNTSTLVGHFVLPPRERDMSVGLELDGPVKTIKVKF